MKEWDFLERIANELLQTLYQRMWFRSQGGYNEGWTIEKIKHALEKAIEENRRRRRMYVYADSRHIFVVEADSKEQACERIKEKFSGKLYNLAPEDVKTLKEFVKQYW